MQDGRKRKKRVRERREREHERNGEKERFQQLEKPEKQNIWLKPGSGSQMWTLSWSQWNARA